MLDIKRGKVSAPDSCPRNLPSHVPTNGGSGFFLAQPWCFCCHAIWQHRVDKKFLASVTETGGSGGLGISTSFFFAIHTILIFVYGHFYKKIYTQYAHAYAVITGLFFFQACVGG